VCERGFGVADGVSGWNDYGFSSSLFSNQLMEFCKSEIEAYIEEQRKTADNKRQFTKMKKSASYLSMENLDIPDDDEEDDNLLNNS
jgi:serine/threonine protein phosphatase PrpC